MIQSQTINYNTLFLKMLLTLTLVIVASTQLRAQEMDGEHQSPSAEFSLNSLFNATEMKPILPNHRAVIAAFYKEVGGEPLWISNSMWGQSKADMILAVLDRSWEHGLNPENYHLDKIRELMSMDEGNNQIKADILLSEAIIHYGHDLSGGRIRPNEVGLRNKDWREPLDAADILNHVARASNTKTAIEELAPQGSLYQQLQDELASLYKTINYQNEPSPIALVGLIKPGHSNKTVLKIRERMGFSADNAPQGPYVYDDHLASAVMAFQKENGLDNDGVIGPQTITIMNLTTQDRIYQVLVNMERLRWMHPVKPDRYVMVNVPSATLWAVQDNKVAFEMPVIVGRKKRQTVIFNTNITGIRFNPRWTVPPTIKREDYLPKLREDPYYLTSRGIELVDANNMTVDPGLINWQEKTWGEVNAMRMVQGSGAANPLGLVRVLMDNPYNIYLHDTPTKSYFTRSNRALSSGCIRMSDPQKFADFVLAPNQGWTTTHKERILATGRQSDIRAEQPLPVYLMYQTNWLGDNGQIVYGHDVYDHDVKILNKLKNINGVGYPETIDSHDREEKFLNS